MPSYRRLRGLVGYGEGAGTGEETASVEDPACGIGEAAGVQSAVM
jgi:hypothetical protein